MSTHELLATILLLSRDERARVAEEVLSSLEEPEDVVDAAWVEELLRTSCALTEGKVQAIPLEAAGASFQTEIERRRAGRTSS
ncbi:MAG: addiction module protein [Planctomycetaceae bacterium]